MKAGKSTTSMRHIASHAKFGIFEKLDLLDAILREARGRAADRAEVEAAMLLAGCAHLGARLPWRA